MVTKAILQQKPLSRDLELPKLPSALGPLKHSRAGWGLSDGDALTNYRVIKRPVWAPQRKRCTWTLIMIPQSCQENTKEYLRRLGGCIWLVKVEKAKRLLLWVGSGFSLSYNLVKLPCF